MFFSFSYVDYRLSGLEVRKLKTYILIDNFPDFYRFEEKYHPSKSVERKRFIRNSMRKRLRIFLDLWEEGYIDKLNLQISESTAVLKFLDRGKSIYNGIIGNIWLNTICMETIWI